MTTPLEPTVDPVSPFPTTDTIESPRPTVVSQSIEVPAGSWQPTPELVGFQDRIVQDCLGVGSPDGYYFLDTLFSYELHVTPAGGNTSLTGLDLNGIYYLEGNAVPQEPQVRVTFNDQNMPLRSWDIAPAACARFTFTVRLPTSDEPRGISDGTLRLQHSETFSGARILVTVAEASLQQRITPTFESVTPTFTGQPDGQSTNQSAIPASSNSPSSSSSSSSPKASILAPAIVVPIVVILAALAAFFLWRRHRRSRMAPSAAFRADHAEAVEALERQGATVGLGGTGISTAASGSVTLPAQSSSYFPLDEKRPLGP